MTDDSDDDRGGDLPVSGEDAESPVRRRMLALGAAGASMVVTIRPALAQAAGSVLTCEIPVPDPRSRGKWIARNGDVVPPYTKGAFQPPVRPVKGEDMKRVMSRGGTLPGTTYDQTQAYTQYIRRLQNGTGGFTCFASLQMPRG